MEWLLPCSSRSIISGEFFWMIWWHSFNLPELIYWFLSVGMAVISLYKFGFERKHTQSKWKWYTPMVVSLCVFLPFLTLKLWKRIASVLHTTEIKTFICSLQWRWIYHHYCAMLMSLISLTWEIKREPDCPSKQVILSSLYSYCLISFPHCLHPHYLTICREELNYIYNGR